MLVDGHGPWHPAVSQFGAGTEPVTTPAIDSGFFEDVYLTVDSLPNAAGGTVGIGVIVQPLGRVVVGGRDDPRAGRSACGRAGQAPSLRRVGLGTGRARPACG